MYKKNFKLKKLITQLCTFTFYIGLLIRGYTGTRIFQLHLLQRYFDENTYVCVVKKIREMGIPNLSANVNSPECI